MTERDSTFINTVRFPLACMVVLLHSYVAVEEYSVYDSWERTLVCGLTGTDIYSLTAITFSHVLTQVAVPLFFFISGYLFYHGLQDWNWQKYGDKLKRRVKTLLVPYLSWNTITAAIVVGIMIVGTLLLGKPIDRIGSWFQEVGGILGIYWSDQSHLATSVNLFGQTVYNTFPILMPMWFIRDLIVVVFLAPLLWYLLKKAPFVMLTVFCLGWALRVGTYIPGLGFASLFMFGWGGHFSLSGKSITEQCGRISNWILVPLFVIGLVLSVIFDGRSTQIGQIVLSIWIVVAMPLIVKWFGWLFDRKPLFVARMKKLSDSTFFVFAFHGVIISYVFRVIWKVFAVQQSGALLAGEYIDDHYLAGIASYFLTPIITIALSIGTYFLLKRILPKWSKLLTGK